MDGGFWWAWGLGQIERCKRKKKLSTWVAEWAGQNIVWLLVSFSPIRQGCFSWSHISGPFYEKFRSTSPIWRDLSLALKWRVLAVFFIQLAKMPVLVPRIWKRLFQNNLIASTTTQTLNSLYIFLLNGNSIIQEIYLHKEFHVLLPLIWIAYWRWWWVDRWRGTP